jgi:hypothetical protein
MVKKCPKEAVDNVVLEACQLGTEAVKGVQAAANVGGELCTLNPC